MNKSFGLLEVKGLATAYYALDKMLKTASVNYISDEKKLGAGLVTVIIEGELSAVNAALEEGKKEASKINKILTAVTINNPHKEIQAFIERSNKSKVKQIMENNNHHEKNRLENSSEFKNQNKIIVKNMAIGLIEIYGYAASLVTADTALKASNVSLLEIDKTKGKPHTPGLIMFLKLGGKIADVNVAVNNALQVARTMHGATSHTIIPNPDIMMAKLIKEGI